MTTSPPVRFLVGPTASGKTAVSLVLARRLDLEVLSLDSMQVYRGLPILTQALPESMRDGIPHHLLEFLDPESPFDTGRYLRAVPPILEGIRQRGRGALFVGGTVLYYRALVEGLAGMPPRDDAVRAQLEQEARDHGPEALWTRLDAVDPVRAGQIHPRDARRLVRALEIHALTGDPPSIVLSRTGPPLLTSTVTVALLPQREALDAAIADRADRMLADGVLEEVRTLQERLGGVPSADGGRYPVLQAVGFGPLGAWLAGRIDRETARDQLVRETRRLARKQMRAFRKSPHTVPVEVAPGESVTSIADRVESAFARGPVDGPKDVRDMSQTGR